MSQDDADLDDDGLKGLRSMWLSLPDEEPPTHGLDALMAAARVKAEEMAQPSLWERFVTMMRRPQFLALATIMILIGGAVFISQRRDQLEVTQSSSGTQDMSLEHSFDHAPAAQTAPVPTGSALIEPVDEAEGRAGGAGAGSAIVVGGMAAADKGDLKPAPTARPADAVVSPPKPVAKKGAPGGAKTTMKPPLEQQAKSNMAAGGATSSLSIDSLDDAPNAAEAEKAAAPDVQEPSVKQQHTQARAAAARNDCATVKALAKKIAAKDAPYYRANIAPDSALAACLN
jgi:hypothetical protein